MKNRLLNPVDALRFAVEFAQLDFSRLPVREVRDAAWRVQLFTSRETPGHWAEKPEPDLVFLKALQERAGALLGQFVNGRAAVEGDLLLTFILTRGNEGHVQVSVHGSPVDRFMYQIVRVLETGGSEKLLVCQASDCDRLFLKVTQKAFCSTRCQSRTYMRNDRARKRETLKLQGRL